MKLLVNATNLHLGGAVQVATSAIGELAAMPEVAGTIHVLASSVVDSNLRAARTVLDSLASYRVYDSHGIAGLWRDSPCLFSGYDAVFTVFGPLYCRRPPARSVTGFAQPWILYPDNEISRQMPWAARMRQRLKYWLQARFFARSDLLVVELAHARDGLVRQGVARANDIRVVHNTLSSLYLNPSVWQAVGIPSVSADLRLGFLGRNYPHKNTGIFPAAQASLKARYGIDARFYVTFTPEEWTACSESFRACAVNVGPLSVAQCPSFYQALDGVVFPSLLECFSATPLEAMAMKQPLFASDRAFIRDVCGDHAQYFDPMNAHSIADVIAEYFLSTKNKEPALAAARDHALNFSNPTDRARQYLACLFEVAGCTCPTDEYEHV